MHSKACKVKEKEVVIEEDNEPEVTTPLPAEKTEVNDNITRKIKKLKDSYSSTWDAKTRHEIGLEIKMLEEL